MNTKLVVMGVAVAMSLSAFCGIQISKVEASQRDKETGKVDITFDVTSPLNEVSVILSAMNTDNNQTVAMNAVYDDQGNFLGNPAKIEPGAGRHLVWNSALDLGKGFYSSSMIVTVRATEGYVIPNDYAIHYAIQEKFEAAKIQAKIQLAALEAQLAALENDYATLTANIAAYNKAIPAYEGTNKTLMAALMIAANQAAEANFACTNVYWTICYTNASQAIASVTGRGAVDLEAKILQLQDVFSVDSITASQDIEGLMDYHRFTTWKDGLEYANDLIEANRKAADKVTVIEGKIDTNNRLLNIAREGLYLEQQKLEKLDYSNTKIQLNSGIATQKVVVDQLCD